MKLLALLVLLASWLAVQPRAVFSGGSGSGPPGIVSAECSSGLDPDGRCR